MKLTTICYSILLSFFLPSFLLYAQPSTKESGAEKKQDNLSFSFASYQANETIAGFQVKNQYFNAQDQVMGIKLQHQKSGAVVHLLQINTVPQAAVTIDTYSHSNNGAAHALEHILLSRGNKGRMLNIAETMTLGTVEASTVEPYTRYHFQVASGMEGFYQLFEKLMGALFQPDFCDEEVRHEIYHLGVLQTKQNKEKKLVEQGTVYSEIESSQGSDDYWFEGFKMALGKEHPLRFSAGGYPSDMRSMIPKDVREFHQNHYILGPGITFIFVIPPSQDPVSYLTKIESTLTLFLPKGHQFQGKPETEKRLLTKPSVTPQVQLIPFPSQNQTEEGKTMFLWKPVKVVSLQDSVLLDLFLEVMGSGNQSIFYQSLIDQKNRELETGATDVIMECKSIYHFSEVVPVFSLKGIRGNYITQEKLVQIRQHLLKKIEEISHYSVGSKELNALNQKALSVIRNWQRTWTVFHTNPPGFGTRRLSHTWIELLKSLELQTTFQKSLVYKESYLNIIQQIQSNQNIWASLVQKTHLLELPYVTAGIPSPERMQKVETEKKQRIQEALTGLKKQYQTVDEKVAISRFEAAEKEKEHLLEKQTKEILFPFTEHPPLSFDDSISYKQAHVAGIPSVNTFFSGISMSEVGLYFDLRFLPSSLYKYLPVLPKVLNSVGLREGNQTTSYQKWSNQIERDIYSLDATYSINENKNRYELKLQGSGANVEETKLALKYMQRVSQHNDLSLENLPRIQDIIERAILEEEGRMKQAEEFWVVETAHNLRMQHDLLYLALKSIPTRTHLLHRVKWQLAGPLSFEQMQEFTNCAKNSLDLLEKIKEEELEKKLGILPGKGLCKKWIEYLQIHIKDFPKEKRLSGFHQLYDEVLQDIQFGKEKTLKEIRQLQELIFRRSQLRMHQMGDPTILEKLEPSVKILVESFPSFPVVAPSLTKKESVPLVFRNLQKRDSSFVQKFPLYVGYVHEDSMSGNIVVRTKLLGYQAQTEPELLRFLAPYLFGGSGSSSLFMTTWQAGLAYGSGIFVRPKENSLYYYATLCPSLHKTLQFVKSKTEDLSLFSKTSDRDYLLANAFYISREGQSPSQRAAALASDLQDGFFPEQIRNFYQKVWNLSKRKDFLPAIHSVLSNVLNQIIWGRGEKPEKAQAETVFFLIANEKQLQEVETDIPDGKLYRIWPSDFWFPSSIFF